MAGDREPYRIILGLAAAHTGRSDAEVLADLARIPPLADEDDPCWDGDAYWDRVAYPYLAFWDVAARRHLQAAIPLILDRACFGDPGEIMRGICHALEAIVKPDYSALTRPCVTALSFPRPGTRMWAAFELKRVRDPSALPALEQAARDEVAEVRRWAARALELTPRPVDRSS